MNALALPVALLVGYLFGSLSFAVIVSRLFGLADPRSYGSKNPGATNVLRSGSKPAALLTLAFDALKGFVPVLLVLIYGKPYGLGDTAAAFVGLAAFLGHLWPVFFGFKGGKGVATATGVLMAINPGLGLAMAVMSLLVVWRHEANIKRLLAGTESRFGQKSPAVPAGPLQGVDSPQRARAHHGKPRKGH